MMMNIKRGRRRLIIRGRKGSSAVLLMTVLGSVAGLTLAFVSAAHDAALYSELDAVCVLAGRSVLAEYDRNLKNDYGLFGFWDDGSGQAAQRLIMYVSESIDDSDGCEYSVSDFCLTNTDVFEKQIAGSAGFFGGGKVIPHPGVNDPEKDRTLRNEKIAARLPSREIGDPGFNVSEMQRKLQVLGSPDAVVKSSATGYLRVGYITERFGSRFADAKSDNHFFNCEAEYILCGKHSDEQNKKAFMDRVTALRTTFNLAHIHSDPEKRTFLMTLAELMTPGPEALVTYNILAAAWAYTESRNDANRLSAGKKVALVKTKDTWATWYGSAVSGSGYMSPANESGYSYDDYLKLFLASQARDIQLARIMDLIQINMAGAFDEGFLLREYNAGISYDVTAGGRVYSYVQEY